MIKPITYKQWKHQDYKFRSESKNSWDYLVDCIECHGEGGIPCDCNCETCEEYMGCNDCFNTGQIDIKELSEKQYSPRKEIYFDHVLSDMKKLADWKHLQLFDVLGSFVKEFRKEHIGVV